MRYFDNTLSLRSPRIPVVYTILRREEYPRISLSGEIQLLILKPFGERADLEE